MREQLQSRLAQLKAEYESGEQMLAELEQKQRALRAHVLMTNHAHLLLMPKRTEAVPRMFRWADSERRAPA